MSTYMNHPVTLVLAFLVTLSIPHVASATDWGACMAEDTETALYSAGDPISASEMSDRMCSIYDHIASYEGRIFLGNNRVSILSDEGSESLKFEVSEAGLGRLNVCNPGVGCQITLNSDTDSYINNGYGLGIGTNQPEARLHVVGESRFDGEMTVSGTIRLDAEEGGQSAAVLHRNGTRSRTLVLGDTAQWSGLEFQPGGSTTLRINPRGGEESPLSFRSTAADVSTRIALYEHGDGTRFRGIGMAQPATGGNGVAIWALGSYQAETPPSDDNPAIFVKDGGDVAIGHTDPQSALHVNGDIRAEGDVYAQDTLLTSDQRLKTDIVTVEDAITILQSLEGVCFDWAGERATDGRQCGIIAQDVEAVLPELVREGPDGYLTVSYSGLVAPLIEGFKAQQAMIDTQADRLDAQDAKLAALQAQIEALTAAMADRR